MKLNRKERLIVFAAFAFALGVAMAHDARIPIACIRPAAFASK